MKTRHTILYILTALLSVFCVQTSLAQATQNALYVFRNDGQFNFFFYGDINRIEYSKVDTLGVEHDDYVTQEVWALDTVYRIPISAIDSVAFVTPENKIKEDVFCPDKSITDYIIASDSVWWILLAPNTPSSLIPNVGDKLLIEERSEWIPNGFGGRVIVSEIENEGIFIATESTPITDIYDRLVVKTAVASPKAAASRTRGLLDGTTFDVPEKTWELPQLGGTLTLNKNIVQTSEGSPVSVSSDLTGTITSTTDIILTYRSCLLIDYETGIHFDSHSVWDVTEEESYALAGGLSSRFEIGYGILKKDFEYASLEVGVGLFVGGSIQGFELKSEEKCHYKIVNIANFDHNDIKELLNSQQDAIGVADGSINSSFGTIRQSAELLDNSSETKADYPTLDNSLLLPNNVSIGVGAYATAELKLSLPVEKVAYFMPDRVKKYLLKGEEGKKEDDKKKLEFGFKLGFDLGVKVDLKAPWALLWHNKDLIDTQPIYKALNEDSEVSTTGYGKLSAEISFGKWTIGIPKEFNEKMFPLYMVPNIPGIRASIDKEEPIRPYRWLLTSPISRNLFLGVDIGFAVFDQEKNEIAKQCPLGWSDETIMDKGLSFFKNGTYHLLLDNLDPGKDGPVTYTAYPLVKLITGREVLAEESVDITVEAARFDIPNRKIFVGKRSGYNTEDEYVTSIPVEVVPNMKNVEVTYEGSLLKEPTWLAHKNELNIYWTDLPENENERRGVIRLKGLSSDSTRVLVEDSIIVIQAEPYIELTPGTLNFKAEGGSAVVKVGKTNLSNLAVTVPEGINYIHPVLVDSIITVAVDPNTEPDERSYHFFVEGIYYDGKVKRSMVDVKQAGTGQVAEPDTISNNKGPFKNIIFMTDLMVHFVDKESETDTIVQTKPAFNFTPDNYTKFEKKREGDIIHFVVEGHEEYEVNDIKTNAVLTFDIDKKEEKVKNLSFTLESESTMKMNLLVGKTTTTTKGHYSMTLADFPLHTNSATWMSTTDFSTADGLIFTSFSSYADSYTVYEDLLLGDHIDPVEQHIDYEPVGDLADKISLWINLNEEETDLTWPTDEVMQSLRNGGMPIYEGETPPKVEGTYLISPLQVVNDKTGETTEGVPDGIVFMLSDQGNGQITYNSYAIFESMATSSGDDIKGLIMGDGNGFTICIPFDAEESLLISGKIQDGAITDCYYTSTNNSIANRYVILKDDDGDSSVTTWSPGADE